MVMRILKALLITLLLSMSLTGTVYADTQVVYYPTTVNGSKFLTKTVKKFITALIKNRCPYAYTRAEKITVTDVSFDPVTFNLLSGLEDDIDIDFFNNDLACGVLCEQLISTKFDVKYKKELKLDNDNIRMTLAETFLAEEMTNESLLSLVSLNSSGAVCR
jgi:hypothetical protein